MMDIRTQYVYIVSHLLYTGYILQYKSVCNDYYHIDAGYNYMPTYVTNILMCIYLAMLYK